MMNMKLTLNYKLCDMQLFTTGGQIKMVRRYGKAPYKIVLVHGGPGAIGSLKGFAQELNERSGIIAVIKYFWPGIPGGHGW